MINQEIKHYDAVLKPKQELHEFLDKLISEGYNINQVIPTSYFQNGELHKADIIVIKNESPPQIL